MWSLTSIFGALNGIYWLVNLKNAPFYWHVRFYTALFYNLLFIKNPPALEADVFRSRTYTTRSPLSECDLNGHKSNSTYFSDLDIARTEVVSDVFKKWINDSRSKTGKFPYVALGAVSTIFRREIKPLVQFQIKSKVVGWDDKWLFVVSKFYTDGGKKFCAVSVAKYVCKFGRKTVPPKECLEACGLWTPEVELKGREGRKKVQGLLDLDQLEHEEGI
ncbi:hypothetical protein V1511DRAFT_508076 [Dipodascopsis uninucleata]